MLAFAALAEVALAEIPAVISSLVDTTTMTLPINCVLAGQQGYEQGGYDIEGSADYTIEVKVWFNGGTLNGPDSTFTSKTGNRGYD